MFVKRLPVLILVILLILLALGCSGSGPDPVLPGAIGSATDTSALKSSHCLLGMWRFTADPEAQKLDITPLRSAGWHLNALPFLEPPPLVNLTLESLDFPDYYTIDADIGLRHPFEESLFTGFDVCGIMFTVGTDRKYGGNIVMAGSGDTQLANPDGFSRWWNPAEFPHQAVFGYSDGLLGTPYNYAAEYNCNINPYKYYCDELGVNDDLPAITPASRGVFTAGTKNIRNYIIKLGARGLTFNYAVDASFEFPVGSEPYNVPGDFPPEASRAEPYRIEVTVVSNTLTYDDYPSASGGGSAQLTVDAYDWYNASADRLTLLFPYGMAGINNLAPSSSNSDYATFDVNIDGTYLNMSGELEILFVCRSDESGYDTFLPGQAVCSYFKYILDVPDATTDAGYGNSWLTNIAYDEQPEVTIDNIGNVFVTGTFMGSVDLNPGPGVDMHSSASPNETDIYLIKFNSGGVYQWGRTWGGTGGDGAYAVAADNLGAAYIGGSFWGTVDFNPGPGTFNLTSTPMPLSPYYSADAFLSKIDTSGNFSWAVAWGGGVYGAVFDTVYDVATDSSNNVYVTGMYADDTVDFNPGALIDNHTSNGGNDAFFCKYNSSGTYLWGLSWGSLVTNDSGKGIAIDDTGFVYVAGLFEGLVDFNPGPVTEHHTSNGWVDAFLSKFDQDGVHQWSRTWGGGGVERALGAAVGSGGDVYAVGLFNSSTDFNPGSGTDVHTPSQTDAYLTKYDTNGAYQWVRTWGGSNIDIAYDVATDGIGNICVAGYFEGGFDFNPGAGVDNHTCYGNIDVYLNRFDSTGNFIWARTWGGTDDDYGTSVSISSTGAVFFGGFFKYVTDLDPGPGYALQGDYSQPGYLGFVLKIRPDGYW